MEPITKADFDVVASKMPEYYERSLDRSRWNYYRVVLNILRRIEFHSVVELGAYMLPLVKDSDTMDIRADLEPTYLWDARERPWPIPSSRYDLFVGLQVLEHLGPDHNRVFEEISRIAKQAIISIPYQWDIPHNANHHNITDETILEWTNHMKPREACVVAPDGEIDASEVRPFSRKVMRFCF